MKKLYVLLAALLVAAMLLPACAPGSSRLYQRSSILCGFGHGRWQDQ